MKTEGIGVACRVTVHLSDWVKAVFSLDCHLTVALVTIGGSAKEVVHTYRTLHNNNDMCIM